MQHYRTIALFMCLHSDCGLLNGDTHGLIDGYQTFRRMCCLHCHGHSEQWFMYAYCKKDLLAGGGNRTRPGPTQIVGRKSEKDQANPHIFCTPFPLTRTWFNHTQTSMDFLHNLPTLRTAFLDFYMLTSFFSFVRRINGPHPSAGIKAFTRRGRQPMCPHSSRFKPQISIQANLPNVEILISFNTYNTILYICTHSLLK